MYLTWGGGEKRKEKSDSRATVPLSTRCSQGAAWLRGPTNDTLPIPCHSSYGTSLAHGLIGTCISFISHSQHPAQHLGHGVAQCGAQCLLVLRLPWARCWGWAEQGLRPWRSCSQVWETRRTLNPRYRPGQVETACKGKLDLASTSHSEQHCILGLSTLWVT